jgi:voltage-gated potassium channel
MSPARRVLRLVGLCCALLVVYFVAPADHRVATDVLVRTVIALGILGFLGYLIVRQFRLQLDLGADYRIDGLLASIFAVVVTFSFAFYLMARNDPGQMAGLHTRVDALYFTVSTLTTVGFGDVHAAGQAARILVLVQMGFNVVFITTAATLLSSRIRTAAEERSRMRRGESSGT